MMLEKISLDDISHILVECEVIINKADRVVDGINHGRTVYKGDGIYYKVFHMDYCRRENFVRACEADFFDGLSPALQSLIEHEGEIIGYVCNAGTPLGSEFDEIPKEFYEKVLDKAKETKMFFYDLVASCIGTGLLAGMAYIWHDRALLMVNGVACAALAMGIMRHLFV